MKIFNSISNAIIIFLVERTTLNTYTRYIVFRHSTREEAKILFNIIEKEGRNNE